MVVTEEGGVLWWGGLVDDDSTRLVHDGTQLEPALVSRSAELGGDPAVMVSAGRGHAAIITESGRVLCFGIGTDGEIPCALSGIRWKWKDVHLTACVVRCVPWPDMARAMWPRAARPRCYLTQSPRHAGRLGNGSEDDSALLCRTGGDAGARDQLVSERASMVSCGYFHTAATTRSGRCYLWGFGGRGQLGTGNRDSQNLPTPVPAHSFGGAKVEFVACGLHQSCAITCQGQLYTWGGGEYGQLGLGDTDDRLHPCLVDIPPEHEGRVNRLQRVRAACAGSYLTAAITESGRLYTWGLGDDGQLGQGQDILVCYWPGPVEIPAVSSQVAAGDAHMACVSQDGRLFTWGKLLARLCDRIVKRLRHPILSFLARSSREPSAGSSAVRALFSRSSEASTDMPASRCWKTRTVGNRTGAIF